MTDQRKHIVVVGAGFGVLSFCKNFQSDDVKITLIDRTNHHLFQPLLYQVAACGLSAPDIAQPARAILSDSLDITVLRDRVTGLDLEQKDVLLARHILHYD